MRVRMRGVRHRVVALAAVAVATGVAAAGCGAADVPDPGATNSTADVRTGRDPDAPFVVASQDLGIHSFTTRPEVPTGSIRLNCSPGWSSVEPEPDRYDWGEFDRVVAQAEAWGYGDILFVFCSTPAWAGTPVTGPDEAVFGPGTAQPPAEVGRYESFARAVIDRYRGRIDGYEVWNEPSSRQFFTGTPQQMGEMTQALSRAVAELDPSAYVLSAGFQTHRREAVSEFIPAYFTDLRERGWPIDAVSAHFYTASDGGPPDRIAQIEEVRALMDRFKAPDDVGLWDTEVNYAVDQAGGQPDGRISGTTAAAWTVQSYLDAWRLGLRRTYWYLWTQSYYAFPGIQMRPGDPSTAALNTLGAWVIGSTFQGCDDNADHVSCRFTRDDLQFRIAWATGARSVTLPLEQDTAVCPVFGAECGQAVGSLELSGVPVRIG